MNLLDFFSQEPNPEIVVEYPKDSGIYHIPIEEVKIMLWNDFDSWRTSNFKFSITPIGHRIFISASVELTCYRREPYLNSDITKYSFVGAHTFIEGESTTGEVNDNYEATALAECIKNASKNLGRKYGMFLNTKRILNKVAPTQTEKPNVKDSINDILKNKK